MLIKFLQWHFNDVPKGLLRAWSNFLVFNLNYFSIGALLKTLFSPWRRYRESYGRGLDIQRYFEAFMFNMISRVIGAVMRIFLIIIGIFLEIFIFLAGLFILLIWLFLPVFLISGLYFGIKILL